MYRWSEELCIGNSKIDEQHRELFRIAERVESILEDCKRNGKNSVDTEREYRILMETAKYLKSYAQTHFWDEEALQLKVGYESFEEHRKLHEEFMNETDNIIEKLKSRDYDNRYASGVLEWISSWLYNHIMNEDRNITAV